MQMPPRENSLHGIMRTWKQVVWWEQFRAHADRRKHLVRTTCYRFSTCLLSPAGFLRISFRRHRLSRPSMVQFMKTRYETMRSWSKESSAEEKTYEPHYEACCSHTERLMVHFYERACIGFGCKCIIFPFNFEAVAWGPIWSSIGSLPSPSIQLWKNLQRKIYNRKKSHAVPRRE